MSEKQKPRTPVLGDHKQVKKKLKPPLLAAMGDLHKPYSWAKGIAPEVCWLASLMHVLGNREGIEVARYFVDQVDAIDTREAKPFYANISSYRDLTDEQKTAIRSACAKVGILKNLQEGLSPFFYHFPEFPLKFLFEPPEHALREEVARKVLQSILPSVFDRLSCPAVITMACCGYLGLHQGKIIVGSEDLRNKVVQDFDAISAYPNTDASRAAASSFRAMVPMFLMQDGDGNREYDTQWSEHFWSQLSGMGECQLRLPTITKMGPMPGDDDPMGQMVFRFVNTAHDEFQERIDLWGFDLNKIETYEVIGGLLARQVSLAVDFAAAPVIWNTGSAPLFLRAMADVVITLAWILKDPDARSLKFIEYGLGNAKLEIAHRKQEMEKSSDDRKSAQMIVEFWEAWVKSQRLPDLVEVNLGAWSGMTTRQMAEEADCLDFYNWVYQPWSDVSHSSWRHVSTANLQYCENPTHHNHRVPTVFDHSPNSHFLYLCAKYLDRAFERFDEALNIKIEGVSAFQQLREDLREALKLDEEAEGDEAGDKSEV